MSEDIYTSMGIKTPSAHTMWKLVKDDEKLQSKIITIVNRYRNYYKCLSDIKNVQVRTHTMCLIMHEGEKEAVIMVDPVAKTYFLNVMKYLYRTAIEEAKIDKRIENSKKLQPSRRQ